jgi:hypothetical protein
MVIPVIFPKLLLLSLINTSFQLLKNLSHKTIILIIILILSGSCLYQLLSEDTTQIPLNLRKHVDMMKYKLNYIKSALLI